MEVSLCFAFSELSFNWSPRALRLFLWRQIHDRVSHSVRKSNALAWCCPGALPSCGVFIYAQWTRTEALPWRWWQIRLWRVLEQSGAVLRVLPSRDGTGVWCKVSEILWTLLCDISTVKVISYKLWKDCSQILQVGWLFCRWLFIPGLSYKCLRR